MCWLVQTPSDTSLIICHEVEVSNCHSQAFPTAECFDLGYTTDMRVYKRVIKRHETQYECGENCVFPLRKHDLYLPHCAQFPTLRHTSHFPVSHHNFEFT